jgi:predicted heme/steroid binding protein
MKLVHRITQIVRFLAILGCCALGLATIVATGGGGDGGVNGVTTEGPKDLPGGDAAIVSSTQATTLTTTEGITLTVPAEALPAGTEVSLVPVDMDELAGEDRHVAAVRFEPEGVTLAASATLRIPLPTDWQIDEELLVYQCQGNDPDNVLASTTFASIVGSPGAYVAEVVVSHFSVVSVARNCHEGTLQHLLLAFQGLGCPEDQALAKAQTGFPSVSGLDPTDIDPVTGKPKPVTAQTIQAFLDTYFVDYGSYNAGEDVNQLMMDQLNAYAREGRHVVVMFTGGDWKPRTGTNNFYPNVMHTAALEVRDGKVQLRNSASAPEKVIKALSDKNGGNVLWYGSSAGGDLTAADMNTFRTLRTGVAVERELCGGEGCFSDSKDNPYGLSWGDVGDRPQPWTAMRIYVLRAKPGENPCVSNVLTVTFSAAPASLSPGQLGSWSLLVDGAVFPVTATFSWGDGTTSSIESAGASVVASHSYDDEGTYDVVATVTDNAGASVQASASVTVESESEATYEWNSPYECSEQEGTVYGWRWNVVLSGSDGFITGYIYFHDCPGGGRIAYEVSGIVREDGTFEVSGSLIFSVGPLASYAPIQQDFILRVNEEPSPNFAP